MENKKDNLDETKVFKTVDVDDDSDLLEDDLASDTLEIPFSDSSKREVSIEDTIIISTQDLEEGLEGLEDDLDEILDDEDDELIDDSVDNLKAAEAEINKVLEMQNGGSGDDDDMAKNKKKLTRLEKINIFLVSCTTLMIVGIIGAGIIWSILVKDKPDLDIEALANQKGAILLDNNKEEFFDLALYSKMGTSYNDITYDDMSQNVVDAFISIEDSRFFKHKGFDIPRFTKAIFENVAAGGFAQGGSTLTMQLLKTAQLTADKDVERKAQEIALSLELESKISKDKIFEYYVNKINYGAGNTRGLEGAAQYYFDKSASELSISESALLAGVVNRPNTYSPINNLENAYIRRDKVIDLMLYHGYIDKDEADLAKSVKIENQLTDVNIKGLTTEGNPYMDYVNTVIQEIKDRLDIDIVSTPLIVHTHMDRGVQEGIAAIQNGDGFTYPDEYIQSGIAIGNNDTGQLIGIGAGRGDQEILGFNRATAMYQQPGSVTKPFFYALAFEHLGWATSHVVEDRPLQYAGTDKILGNADGRYRGEVELKNAVATSLNTPVYTTLLEIEAEIGRNGVADYLHDALGFNKVSRESYNTQYAIGGSTFQLSPAELFAAQAVLMNGGYYTKPHTVDYVETMENEVIKEEFDYPKTKVLSEETAYLVSVLENYNVESGIINRMEILKNKPYKVYAKTGTTDYGDSQVHLGIPNGAGKDQWMMASSRQYTSVVWMGWDKPEAGKETYWTNYKYNQNALGKMNNVLLDYIHKGKDNPGNVTKPGGISNITHVISTFPYANPIADMDTSYITNGEINSKFLNLVDLDKSSLKIENVETFTAELKANRDNKTVTLNWTEYPEEDGAIKGKTYDISLGSIKATGTRLFDPSWIFGEVKYKATVYVDGKEFDTIDTNTNTFTKDLVIPNGSTIKVCGFYGNSQQDGPESCSTPENPDVDVFVTMPAFKNKGEVQAFIKQHGLDAALWRETEVQNTEDLTKDNTVFALVDERNLPVIGKEYTVKDLKTAKFAVTYYKYVKPEVKPDPDPNPNPDPNPPGGTNPPVTPPVVKPPTGGNGTLVPLP